MTPALPKLPKGKAVKPALKGQALPDAEPPNVHPHMQHMSKAITHALGLAHHLTKLRNGGSFGR